MIEFGQTRDGHTVGLPLRFANRHGLISGATGTGKTVTLQRLAEEFSKAGVPVFAADVKGDLTGVSAPGKPDGPAASRAAELKRIWQPVHFPTCLWDLFGEQGFNIHTSVHAMGPDLLASMLRLNDTQSGTLNILFKRQLDREEFILNLDDLRGCLLDLSDYREEVCREYGHVTANSIATIQRQVLALEAQGGENLFGEPPFDINDFMRTENDRGVINLLSADRLLEAPKLYATFLLWLLTELFRVLPEAGDLNRPKLVFFFDEAHLLFRDAPKPLLEKIERLVRLVRSKGVGVFFVTQSPADVPNSVLAQLGTRIQHALRAFTPADQKFIKAAAQSFRPNKEVDVKSEILELGTGEALISPLQDDGTPLPVERVHIFPPTSQIGPITQNTRYVLMELSPLYSKYEEDLFGMYMYQSFIDRTRSENGLKPIEWPDYDDESPPVNVWRDDRSEQENIEAVVAEAMRPVTEGIEQERREREEGLTIYNWLEFMAIAALIGGVLWLIFG